MANYYEDDAEEAKIVYSGRLAYLQQPNGSKTRAPEYDLPDESTGSAKPSTTFFTLVDLQSLYPDLIVSGATASTPSGGLSFRKQGSADAWDYAAGTPDSKKTIDASSIGTVKTQSPSQVAKGRPTSGSGTSLPSAFYSRSGETSVSVPKDYDSNLPFGPAGLNPIDLPLDIGGQPGTAKVMPSGQVQHDISGGLGSTGGTFDIGQTLGAYGRQERDPAKAGIIALRLLNDRNAVIASLMSRGYDQNQAAQLAQQELTRVLPEPTTRKAFGEGVKPQPSVTDTGGGTSPELLEIIRQLLGGNQPPNYAYDYDTQFQAGGGVNYAGTRNFAPQPSGGGAVDDLTNSQSLARYPRPEASGPNPAFPRGGLSIGDFEQGLTDRWRTAEFDMRPPRGHDRPVQLPGETWEQFLARLAEYSSGVRTALASPGRDQPFGMFGGAYDRGVRGGGGGGGGGGYPDTGLNLPQNVVLFNQGGVQGAGGGMGTTGFQTPGEIGMFRIDPMGRPMGAPLSVAGEGPDGIGGATAPEQIQVIPQGGMEGGLRLPVPLQSNPQLLQGAIQAMRRPRVKVAVA